MALITFPSPWPNVPDVSGPGSRVLTDPGRFSVSFPDGTTETYVGSFTYPGAGPVEGSVTGFEIAYGGSTILAIHGFNVPASVIYAPVDQWYPTLLAGADSAMGSIWGDYIDGYEGADTVIALDGNDTVYGGAGNDDLNGNVGEDEVEGEGGADWVRGGKGNDTIGGGAGDDPHVNGNLGDDEVYGDAGNDTVYGGQGDDSLDGGDGDDLLSGDLGDDFMMGGFGADRFVLRPGDGENFAFDFNPAQGDRVQLPFGAAYQTTVVNNNLLLSIGVDGIVLVGVTDVSQVANWIVYA